MAREAGLNKNCRSLQRRIIKLNQTKFFQVFLQKIQRAAIFYLLAHPAETAYLSFRDQELSNDVPLVEFRRRKVAVHIFLWVVPGHCLHAGFMECHNFFVLRPIRVKFHIRTRLIESFPTTYWLWWCAEEKWHFTPVHTLCQLKRDEGLFPPLRISLAGRNVLKNLPRQIFSECV